jgi:signal transduction histidine kinase
VHIEAKKQIKLSYLKFDFVEFLDEILDKFQIVLKFYNLKLEFRYRKQIFISADKAKLRLAIECILYAVIENAYKNSTLQITINARNNNLNFEVRNHSDYMDETLVGYLFDKDKPIIDSPYHYRRLISHSFFVAKEMIHAHFGSKIIHSYQDNINIFGFNIPID